MARRGELRVIYTGRGDAFFNMAMDEVIARSVIEDNRIPTLRFYLWDRPSLSIGYFQNLRGFNLEYIIKNNIPVVRRPTGGRAILHDRELTYSFSTRLERVFRDKGIFESYRIISDCILRALKNLGIPAVMSERKKGNGVMRNPLCFMSISFGEITVGGKKIVGSAQKRYRDGFLQQGSIPFKINEMFKDLFRVDNLNGMAGIKDFIDLDDEVLINKLIEYISIAMADILGVEIIRDEISSMEIDAAIKLRDLYAVKLVFPKSSVKQPELL